MKPVRLGPNQPARVYRGGAAIAEFRSLPQRGDNLPEDWVGSTTCLFGCEDAGTGLTRLEDGRTLKQAVEADPDTFLGPAHRARFGADPALLVKLLDAGQRLPVHCHPDRTFSRRHLGLRYGKTEAWIVIATSGDEPRLYLGFREPVEAETLLDWVVHQQTTRLLSAVNVLPARPGQAILVPAGIPHAIGEGIFVLELQEPTDLSILMEWRDLLPIDGMKEGHLGLGFEVALQAVDRTAWPPDRLETLAGGDRLGGRMAFPEEADPFFRAERIRPRGPVELSPSFAILVVLEGQGRLQGEGWSMPVARGETLMLPFGAGTCRLEGQLSAVRCLPPQA